MHDTIQKVPYNFIIKEEGNPINSWLASALPFYITSHFMEVINVAWENQAAKWLANDNLDTVLKQQLLIEQNNKELMEDSFYKNLSFGTAGLRGELGFGTNRMNIYTVRKAALGLATYIISCGEIAMKNGVVIAYDSRHY